MTTGVDLSVIRDSIGALEGAAGDVEGTRDGALLVLLGLAHVEHHGAGPLAGPRRPWPCRPRGSRPWWRRGALGSWACADRPSVREREKPTGEVNNQASGWDSLHQRGQHLADRAPDHHIGQVVHGRGLPLTMMTPAPGPRRAARRRRWGRRDSVEPTASSRSQDRAAASARRRSAGTRLCPKLIVADLRMPPQRRQGGSSSPPPHPFDRRLHRACGRRTTGTPPRASCRGPRRRDLGPSPPARCRPSMFWVSRQASRPVRSRSTRARWPALGWAPQAGESVRVAPGPLPHLRVARGSGRCGTPSRPPGPSSTRPFGPRKSGMPLSVLMPAPVRTTMRRAVASSSRAESRRSCIPSRLPLDRCMRLHEST